MRSLLLTSILVATVAIPIGTARDPDARRGLRRALLFVALFNAVYALACVYVFHRLP
jgi:hypothetical protein